MTHWRALKTLILTSAPSAQSWRFLAWRDHYPASASVRKKEGCDAQGLLLHHASQAQCYMTQGQFVPPLLWNILEIFHISIKSLVNEAFVCCEQLRGSGVGADKDNAGF